MTTISMSDADYAALADAAAWIHRHSGIDAPEYPALDRLNRTVDAIARRRADPYRAGRFDLRDQQASGAEQLR